MRALLGLLLALFLFAGCTIEGRIQATSVSGLDVDLTVRGARSPYCSGDIPGISVTPGNEPGGVVGSCHYVGKVDLTTVGSVLGLASAGEYLVLVLNPYQLAFDGPQPGRIQSDVEGIDVTVVMPGSVLEHNGGAASGSQVRITDITQFEVPGGLRIVALNHPGPPWWQWWAGGGFFVGALLGLALIGVLRRGVRRRAAARPESSEVDAPGETTLPLGIASTGSEVSEPSEAVEESTSVWARPEPEGPNEDPGRRDPGRSDPTRWAPES